jgi:AraC family transcriptional regulator
MDWIRGLQRAIDYIEENLTGELDFEKIAEKAYSSSFHFQRTFNLMTGITIGEYIRNRRLTLAGEEFSSSEAKVIDVAFKYGYETPESFTKAFTRYHGITPSAARQEGARLKSFNRLSITITLKGGNIMDYEIVRRDSFTVLTKARSFVFEESGTTIPAFWTESKNDHTIQELCEHGVKEEVLGICEPEKKGEKTFRYGIGIECRKDVQPPQGYEVWTVPARTWAVFKCIGPMPASIRDMWKRIYTEFLPQSDYERLDDIDFELYPDDDTQSEHALCEIWIPVKKKAE